MGPHGSLTDTGYWDHFWSGTATRVIAPDDPLYGRNGDFLRMMRRRVGPLDGKTVIELGGALSYRALALAKWCDARVVLSDFSPVGLQRTAAIFEANDCQAELVFGDFFAWDAGGRTFDLVTHYGVLEHFDDVEAVLRLCGALLAPGGALLFTMPNMEAWGAALWRRWAPRNWSTHIFHSDQRIREASAAVGLRVTDTFHAGSPLLRITPWERHTTAARVLTTGQHEFDRVGAIVPLYHLGWRPISRYRGFVVRAAPAA